MPLPFLRRRSRLPFHLELIASLVARRLYRVRANGLEHFPREGGVLLLCNHISYVDVVVLQLACPRPIRFVMDHRIFNTPFIGWIFRTAKAIAAALKKEARVDIVFTGKEAIDDGAAQVSQLVAEAMALPYVTVVLNAEYSADAVKCRREVEGGAIEVVTTPLPALIAAQKGMNEPRYASLPNIMKAKKKEVKALKEADLGVSDADQKIRYRNFQLPPPKQAGKKISGDPASQAKELARLLHEEAKVI